MISNYTNRRSILEVLGAGATATLAGCNTALEPENSEDENSPNSSESTNQDELDLHFGQIENTDLSNVDPSSTEPETYGLPFSADAAEADGNVTIQLTNGIQNQSHDTSTNDLELEDGDAVLYLPENMLVHGDTEISVTFTDEDQEGTLTTEMSTQTPQAFPIDRRVEGEQVSNFQTPWSFAQHNLDREEARQAHLNYVNNEFVWNYDTSNSEYSEAFDEIASLNPNQEMETILTRAGNVASDIDGKRSPGTTQSGLEVGFTTSEIARKVNDEISYDRLRTINVSNPENSQDRILQLDTETETFYLQRPTKVSEGLDEPVLNRLNNISDSKYARSTIFGFEPGEIEGIDYERKSENAINSLNSAVTTTPALSSTKPINDYAIEIISQEHLFGDGDTQEALDTLASLNRVEEMVNHDINGDPLYEVGESLENAMYIGLAADPGDNLEDMTMFVTDNGAVYDNITTNSEPTSKSELEQMAELN